MPITTKPYKIAVKANTIMVVPDLQRRPKIRRTGEYDDLYSMSSKSYSI